MNKDAREILEELKAELEEVFEKLGEKFEEVVEDVEEFLKKLKEKARIKDGIPDDVRREIYNFYSSEEGSDKSRSIAQAKRAYLYMKDKLEKAEIPEAEKEGIERNLKRMYPGNYLRQNAEVQSMIDTVLTVMKNNK